MGFDFFKKKGKDRGEQGDELEFDDLEASGEFLSSGDERRDAPPPPPPAPGREPSSAYPPPPPPPPPPPAPRQAAPPPPPPPPAPPAHGMDDDITIVNAPSAPVAPAPQAPPPPPPPQQAGPVPPGPPRPPAPPGPPVPPAPPQAGSAQPPTPAAPQAQQPAAPPPPPPAPYASDDEVTQVLSTPVTNEALVAWLVVATGAARGQDHRLPGGTVRLGHGPNCEIRISGDTYISTQHAEITFRSGAFWIKDLNSTNGTFVNEGPVSEVALADGDRVKVGMTELVFKSLKL